MEDNDNTLEMNKSAWPVYTAITRFHEAMALVPHLWNGVGKGSYHIFDVQEQFYHVILWWILISIDWYLKSPLTFVINIVNIAHGISNSPQHSMIEFPVFFR